jgi:uncharacterized protein (TIGR02594 family)
MKFPKGYEWLGTVGTLPRTIATALPLLGVTEVVGRGSNKTIIAWRDELNAASGVKANAAKIEGYSDDDIPWCGLFAAIVTFRAGKMVVTNPLWARNWAKFGVATKTAGLGDVLVFERPGGGGHVGFYIAETATQYLVLGGNQGNRVSIVPIDKSRCIAIRRPAYTVKPSSVKAYTAKGVGKSSTNEA